uniref:DNA polymerase epsilon subunit 3 n=1 Tax=Ditylenchus dipsaci TaxID=166011 RepID=A0A915DSL3_9BILA
MDIDNVEDLKLPQAVITRLVKEALPPGVNVSKEARTAIARSAAIFVLHTTTYANEYALAHKRKNVTAEDVFHAIKILECEELEKPLMEAMEAFKVQRLNRLEARRRRSAANATGSGNEDDNTQHEDESDEFEEAAEHNEAGNGEEMGSDNESNHE